MDQPSWFIGLEKRRSINTGHVDGTHLWVLLQGRRGCACATVLGNIGDFSVAKSRHGTVPSARIRRWGCYLPHYNVTVGVYRAIPRTAVYAQPPYDTRWGACLTATYSRTTTLVVELSLWLSLFCFCTAGTESLLGCVATYTSKVTNST